MRFRNFLVIFAALVVVNVMFRVVLPWFGVHVPSWWIVILIGVVGIAGIYVWLVGVTLAGALIPRWFTRFMVIILLVFYAKGLFNEKYPWTAKAMEARQYHNNFLVTDVIDPKQPMILAKAVHDVKLAVVEIEEEKRARELYGIKQKVRRGESLSSKDSTIIVESAKRVSGLKKELSKITFVEKDKNKKGKEKLANNKLDVHKIRYVHFGEVIEVDLDESQWSNQFFLMDLKAGKRFKVAAANDTSMVILRFIDGREFTLFPEPISLDLGQRSTNAKFWLKGKGVAVITY